MGQQIGPQALDETRVYKLALSGVGAAPSLAGHFDGSEEFAAKLWPGGTYATSAVPTAAWDATLVGNPASLAAPVVLLTIAKATIAALDPGTYQIEVIAGVGTLDELVFQGSILLTPAPGATAQPRVYCSYQGMLDECGWLGRVEGLEDARAAQFLPERAQASRTMERWALARWRRAQDDQATRHGPLSYVAPYLPTTGLDAGPAYGDSAIPDTGLQAAEAAFAALLASPGLSTDYAADFGGLARLTALYAIYLALDDQHGNGPDDTPYQVLAGRYRTRAIRAALGVTFRVLDAANAVTYELEP